MDERVVYPGQADREAAQERAEARYWKAHAAELSARVASLESLSVDPPTFTRVASEERMPDLGSASEAAVAELLVRPGDRVSKEQLLMVVETNKVSMDIPASHFGVIQSLHVKVGDKVNQGTLMALYVAPDAGQVFQDVPWEPEMVVLPQGKFIMGSPAEEPGRSADEGPQHEVTIAYPLALGKYPVTFEQWDACVADGGTAHKPNDSGWGRGKRPVINVSWHDAQDYVAWLNQKLGIAADDPTRYRLPSEAEWEYACRAGTRGLYSTPGGLMNEYRANYNGSYTFEGAPEAGRQSDKTTPVGMYAANPWGLHDMHGNVWEWVQDRYEDSYPGAPSDGSAWDSGSSRRVLRGGSWYVGPQFLRSAYRCGNSPVDRYIGIGFRLARTVS